MQLKDCGLIVLGGGMMGTALVKGLLASNSLSHEKIVLIEKDINRLDILRREEDLQGLTIFSRLETSTSLDIMVLAVKPQDVVSSLNACLDLLSSKTLVISLAAGVTLATLAASLPLGQPIMRVMSNTGILARQGISVLTPGSSTNPEQLKLAQDLFASVGATVVVPEKHMDAVTAVSASGMAYMFLIIEAMIDGAVQQGLDRQTATVLTANTMLGACHLMLERNEHPAVLKSMVTSSGGTTINGLAVMEKAGMRGIIMEAINAAAQRSRELSRSSHNL
ncbi:MAG: pyrroline-5-carboxylate reductase [Desulfarculales bacterium]|nr:pyrroline-5-carboxylate reductase [Desulfarculales bacterium]